jgi:thiosulfate/3-mercaptopyruvate sulfurtransferase
VAALRERPLVLDARDLAAFRAGHLPGSRPVDWRDGAEARPGVLGALLGDASRWGRLRPVSAGLQDYLRSLGLQADRPVLVVGDPAGWGEEGRVAWSLLTWGARDVALLDGGFPAWQAAGLPVERGPAEAGPRGDFTPSEVPQRRIRRDPLLQVVLSRSRPLLDARTAEEFAGERFRGQRRGGHLPGARLVPQRSLVHPDGRYATAAELRALVGPLPQSPITYCTGGVRSALLALLLEARLGVVAANYDGSLWEWSADPALPLER